MQPRGNAHLLRSPAHLIAEVLVESKEIVTQLAQRHAADWKRASKSNAEIINEIVASSMKEGRTREESLDLADDTLRYLQRYF